MKPLEKTLKQLAVVVMVLMITIPVKGQWGTNGNDIYNTNTGYVGIGTTGGVAPMDLLNVYGGQVSISQYIVSNSTYDWLAIRSNRGINDYGGLYSQYAKIYLATLGPTTTGESSDHTIGDVRIATKGSGGNATLTDRMAIRYNGNVGIGTTAPNGLLQVGNNLTATTLYLDNQTGYGSRSAKQWLTYSASDANQGTMSGGAGLTIHNNDVTNGNWSTLAFSTYEGTGGNNVAPAAIRARFTDRGIGSWAKGDLAFFTAPDPGLLERMRITSAGDVGIGTTGPMEKLHIGGANEALRLDYNGTDQYFGSLRWAGLQLGNNGANRIIAGRTTTGGFFDFYVNNTNDAANYNVTPDGILAMRINNNGNVGIGLIPSNSYKLEVAGPIRATGALFTGDLLSMKSQGKEWLLGPSSDGDLGSLELNYHNGTSWLWNLLTIPTSGDKLNINMGLYVSQNVGIGTQPSGYKLDIRGSGSALNLMSTDANRAALVLYTQGDNANDFYLGTNGINDRYSISARNSAEGYDLNFYSHNGGWNSALTIDWATNGNIGIGTQTPTEKLTVNGKILAEEVQVVVDVPDYVFAKEYKLKTLSEVSKFINEHKHLPEVPSENEVLDNCGHVSLGEMNMTLLKKIEELTLYAIEQEKTIEEMKAQFEQLRAELTTIKK